MRAHRSLTLFGIAIGLVLACVLCAGVGVGGYWLGRTNAPPGNGPPAGIAKAKGEGAADADDLTYQDLQDHLAKKGLNTSRGISKRGMLFVPGDGRPLGRNSTDVLMCNEIGPRKGQFIAKKFVSPKAAEAEAARIKDVEQRDVLPWKRWVFYEGADPGALETLKSVLEVDK